MDLNMQLLFEGSNESNWERRLRIQAEASPAAHASDALLSAEKLLLEIEGKWRAESDKETRMSFQRLYKETRRSLAQQPLLPFGGQQLAA